MRERCDNDTLKKFAFWTAADLSGPIYGNLLSHGGSEEQDPERAKVL